MHTDRSPRSDTPSVHEESLRALYELAVAAAGVLDPVALARIAVEQVGPLLRVDDVWFYGWDDAAGCLVGLASWGRIPVAELRPVRPDEAPVDEAFRKRGPVVVSRTSRSRRAVTALAVAPVIVDERPIGALIARADAPHRFSAEQIQTLSLLATQVGPTIEAARLFIDAQRRRAEAEALAEIMAVGAIDRDPDRVLGLICERACQLIGADYAGVALTEPDGTRSWRGMWGNRTDAWRRPGSPRGRGPFAESTATGKAVVWHLPDSPPHADDRMLTHYAEGGRTVLSAPMPGRGAPPGALLVGWRSDVNPTPAQMQLAEMLASYAALLVNNMRARAQRRAAAREAQQRAEQLAASEERLRTLYEALSCGVLVKDAEQRVIHANAAAEEILGYRFEQMRGRTTETLWQARGEDGAPLPSEGRASALAIRARRPIRKFTACIVRPDGEPRWLQVDSVPVFGPNGELTQVVSSFIDITERKRMEEELLRAQRLEVAGRIAGQVAHDFNNLLAPLVGYPELIKMRLPPDHPAVAYCDAMADAARQMASINEDLLALGRRGQFDHTQLDLNAIVREGIQRLGPLPASLTVELQLAPDLLPIRGSATQLERALTNLLTNAREAMGDIGTITVRTSNAYIDEPTGHYARIGVGEYVALTVADHGPGIRPEICERIFDPFFTTKVVGRRRGSGLGLSVVEAIVQDHHGHIDFESEPDQGTRFTLYFPPARDTEPEPPPAPVCGGNETILVIDDDPAARQMTGELLTALGYTVITATCGEEALAMLEQAAADLLVLDMVMPGGIDGAETYRRALALNPGQRAIVLSGFAEGDRAEQVRALGIAAFLRKPVRLDTLALAVRAALDAT